MFYDSGCIIQRELTVHCPDDSRLNFSAERGSNFHVQAGGQLRVKS